MRVLPERRSSAPSKLPEPVRRTEREHGGPPVFLFEGKVHRGRSLFLLSLSLPDHLHLPLGARSIENLELRSVATGVAGTEAVGHEVVLLSRSLASLRPARPAHVLAPAKPETSGLDRFEHPRWKGGPPDHRPSRLSRIGPVPRLRSATATFAEGCAGENPMGSAFLRGAAVATGSSHHFFLGTMSTSQSASAVPAPGSNLLRAKRPNWVT